MFARRNGKTRAASLQPHTRSFSLLSASTTPNDNRRRRSQNTPALMARLSSNRMVEPSPPALHLLSGGDASMVGVRVKVEQEDCGGGVGVLTNAEHLKKSPSCDWPGSNPLEARQLTPPLSCSPSVQIPRQAEREKF